MRLGAHSTRLTSCERTAKKRWQRRSISAQTTKVGLPTRLPSKVKKAWAFRNGSSNVTTPRSLALAFALSAGMTSAACAVTLRTAVSVSGVDTGNCAPAAPCRTLSYAMAQVYPGGEIYVLSSGGYGPFVVDKSVSVTAPSGIVAAITAQSGDAITISASPTDVVSLTGFNLNGAGTGANGIKVNGVGALNVIQTAISGFTQQGINFVPNAGSGIVSLSIEDSSFSHNAIGSLLVRPTGAQGDFRRNTARTYIRNSSFVGTPLKFSSEVSGGTVSALIVQSRIRFASSIVADSGITGTVPVQISVDQCEFFSSQNALATNGPLAQITYSRSIFTKIVTILNGQYGAEFGSGVFNFSSARNSLVGFFQNDYIGNPQIGTIMKEY